jgi:hypothetical protein
MTLSFDYDNRYYSLGFNSRVAQIAGDSGAGKSLMFQDLRHCMNRDAELAGQVLLMSVSDNRALTAEQRRPYKYIVVDNADLVMSPEMDDEVVASTLAGANYWVLFGREPRNCVSSDSVGVLKHEARDGKHFFYVDYAAL